MAAPIPVLVAELRDRIGAEAFLRRCVALLEGADREDHLDVLPYLTGFDLGAGTDVLDRTAWNDHWLRTWGARGLLHAWDERATDAVVAGLSDTEWRPAEMCLKVTARHRVAGAGDAAAALAEHRLPRVRAQAMRALAATGDTEHVAAVRARLDDVAMVAAAAERALDAMRTRLDLP